MMSQDSTRPHSSSCACRQFCTIVRTHASSTRRSFSWNEYAYTSVFWRLLSRWGNGAIETSRWDRLFLENDFSAQTKKSNVCIANYFFFILIKSQQDMDWNEAKNSFKKCMYSVQCSQIMKSCYKWTLFLIKGVKCCHETVVVLNT